MFPEELVVEILKRLPVKSLYRCMSVCKSWHSLITSSYFTHTHLNYQKDLSRVNILPKTCGLYSLYNCYWGHFVSTLKFHAYFEGGFFCPIVCDKSMLCFCDGMVCFLCYSGPRDRKYFTIWNPSQEKSIKIDFPRGSTGALDRILGFHFACGFGFDSSRNDYNVVILTRTRNLYVRVYVYSLRARTWKARDSTISLPAYREVSRTADNVEDVVYWTTPSSVLMYNLAEEKLSEIPFPESFDRWEGFPILPITICVRGKDFVGVCWSYASDNVFWVMDECGKVDSWREYLRISSGLFPIIVQNVPVNGEFLLEADGKPFVSLDPKSTRACILSSDGGNRQYYVGFVVESLVPLGSRHGTLSS